MNSFKVKNTSAEVAPPGCVLELAGAVDADGTISVRKPTLSNSSRFLVNGLAAIPALSGGVYSFGQAFPPSPQFVAGTVDADALAALDTIGTKAGDWFLRSGQTGFFCLGSVSHGLVNAMPDPFSISPAPTSSGFYAKLTGGTGPYSWTESTVSGGTVSGARTGTLNAVEVISGLTGIPVDGTVVVWMTGSGSSYQFAARMFSLVTSWTFSGSGSSCTITPATTRVIVISGQNLCGSLS